MAAATAAGSLGIIGSSTAASATRVCAPSGQAHTTVGIPFSPLDAPASMPVGFNFSLGAQTLAGLGACSDGTALLANGSITGGLVTATPSCLGGSVGNGVTDQGHAFSFSVAGAVIIATGGLDAAALILPDAGKGSFCLPTDALGRPTDFVLIGAALEP